VRDTTPLPKVLRTCVVCECLGERRLGDHLMNGIERLIPLLLPSIDTAAALAVLGPNRQADGIHYLFTFYCASTQHLPAI
jgi:hypothetical protein